MPSTYREALDFVVSTGSRGMKVGLERTEALLDELGSPQRGLRGALVAGTNGKGSTCAMVESACRAAGLRTALLVKPHLRSYRERIVLDGSPIDEGRFAELIDAVRPAVAAVEARLGAPTQFEILTAAGIVAAHQHGADAVVCEVGLGGRLDSTNVLDLGVAGITSIDLDHRQYLGDTVEEIAAEKAGIIKPGDDVVAGAAGPALNTVKRRAREAGAARVLVLGEEIRHHAVTRGLRGVDVHVEIDGVTPPQRLDLDLQVPLAGGFQGDNAALAAAICSLLAGRGLGVGPEAIRRGVSTVRWPGRLQWVRGEPPIILDGAHNAPAIRAIVPAVADAAGGRALVALVGAMADKDLGLMLDALRPLRPLPVFTQMGTPRAASAVELARLWGPGARAISSLPDALAAARMLAGSDGVVLVCGSIYLIGDVLALIEPL